MNAFSASPTLRDILVARGHISLDDVRTDDGHVTREQLLARQLVTAEQLAAAMAEQLDLPYVNLSSYSVPRALFEVFPAEFAYRYHALPYRQSNATIEIAVSDPYDLVLRENIERIVNRPVRYLVASAQAIDDCLKRSEGGFEILQDVSKDFRLLIAMDNREGGEEYVSLDDLGAERDGSIIQLVNSILAAALQKRASDIHIEATPLGVVIKFRIDGVLYAAMDPLDSQHHAALASRIKVMAALDIAERRIPQDGRFRLSYGELEIDFRVSVLPSVHGEDVVIRILDSGASGRGGEILRLDQLGMAPTVLKEFRRAIQAPYGMVLVAGPTGSGKTTTLYAAVREIDTNEEKVITIEDPVEYQLAGVVQIPVNEKKGLTFAKGLRSILRHDPDKIMVGEIRDAETAQIAVQSALTGHLVFSTIHANSAFDVIDRFRHMGIDEFDFTSVVTCVVAQRLVRLICPQCRQKLKITADELHAAGLVSDQHLQTSWYVGKGCDHCLGTGYRGRAAITELLSVTPTIKRMLIARSTLEELKDEARRAGMLTLRQSAIACAVAGNTTLKEINRVTFAE